MAGFTRVVVDELAVAAFIRTEVDPALARLAGPELAGKARRSAPVYSGPASGEHVPGVLRDSVGWRMAPDGGTEIFAAWYDLFLELPARQIPVPVRTLEQALGDLPAVL